MTAMYSKSRFCNLEFYWTTCLVARATSDTRTQCPQRSVVRDLNNQSALNLSSGLPCKNLLRLNVILMGRKIGKEKVHGPGDGLDNLTDIDQRSWVFLSYPKKLLGH